MKTTKTNPASAPATDALIIGALTFSECVAPAVRGDPSIVYRTAGKNTGCVSFNAASIDATPALADVSRFRVFIAEGKPAVFLQPCGPGEGTTFMRDGAKSAKLRKKIQGRCLAKLSAYQRIDYKIEPVESPRKGWLLSPTSSERKA